MNTTFNTASPANKKRFLATLVETFFGRADDDVAFATADPQLDTPEVVVAPIEGKSPIDSLREAITAATAKFAALNVAPIYEDDATYAFKVRELKIEIKNAPPQFLREIEALPTEVLHRVAKARMEKAHGAAELLLLGDFFGATLVADINTVVGGYMVDTAVAYSGGRFSLNFAFLGGPGTRPVAVAPVPVLVPAPPSAPVATASVAPPAFTDALMPSGKVTPIATSVKELPSGKDTPISPVKRHTPAVVARLHLRSCGDETTLLLQEDDFPYAIGRHDSFVGYSVKGRRDSQAQHLLNTKEPTNHTSFTSRNHLVLDSFDASAQQFCVVTEGGKNGSYFKGGTLPGRFILPIAQMASGDWLKLGGSSGDGILEIRIEAV